MIVELFGELLLLLLQWVGGDVASTLISFRFARCYRYRWRDDDNDDDNNAANDKGRRRRQRQRI